MKWFVIPGLIVIFASSCLTDNRCEVEGELIRCPGGIEVAVEPGEGPPEDARCLTDGQEVVCNSGHVYEVGAPDRDGDESGNEHGRDSERGNDDIEIDERVWSSCESSAGEVMCSDEKSYTGPEVSSGDECVSLRRPGAGPRIRCEGANGIKELLPDGVSEGVTCSYEEEGIVRCDDGAVLHQIEEECDPTVAMEEEGYTLICGELAVTITTEEDWCGFPSGRVELQDDSEALSCRFVFGDVIAADTGLRDLWQLGLVEVITGDLLITGNDQLNTIELGQLRDVDGRIAVRGNQELSVAILPVVSARGGIEVSGNPALEALVLSELKRSGELVVGTNRNLMTFELSSEVRVEGVFLFLDNSSYPGCFAAEFLVEMTERASGGAYVGGMATSRDSRWAC